ncbi:MAG TPA: hypothetical protein P5038_00320 [Candidatus Paceibacterota bacterium]|jgi:hypothetical protein|nr:hypothetical protein [Candidatus Paceibacterota bacterium]
MKASLRSFILAAIVLSVAAANAAQTLRFQPHPGFGFRGDGSIQPGDYYWLTATTGTGTGDNLQRGMAYNPLNNHLYIPHRTNSVSVPEGIHILDADTGQEIYPGLDLSGITNGGTISMVKIGVAEDGVIYAMNFGSWPGTRATVYRWSDESAVATIAFAGNPAPTTSSQWGYTFDVRGKGTNTQILLTTSSTSASAGTVASLLTTADGTNFTARQLNTDAPPGSIGYFGAAAFGPGNTFWAKSLNNPLQYFSFDTNSGTATTLRLYELNEFPATIGPFGLQLQSNWLAGVDVSTPDSVMLFSFTNTTGELTYLSKTNTPTDNLNRYAMGSVIFRRAGTTNVVYVLNCNNGILALDVVPEPAPAEPPYISGPVLRYGPEGSDITFSAFVLGSEPLSLQWQVSHSISNTAFENIPWGTGRTLTLTNVSVWDEGLYRLTASNPLGQATSVEVQLLVMPKAAGVLEPLWSLAPGSRPYITADASSTPFQRSIAYNALSNQVLIVSRTNANLIAGLTINVLDGTTGAHLYRLNTNGLPSGAAAGSISLLCIAVADDGAVYAANEVNAAAPDGNGAYRLYRWADTDPNTLPELIYSGQPAGESSRWGDTLAIRGSGTNTEILIDGIAGSSPYGGTWAAILVPSNGVMNTWISKSNGFMQVATYSSGLGRSLQFGQGNTYWQKRKGGPLMHCAYDLEYRYSTELASYAAFSTNLGAVTLDFSRNLLAGIDYATIQQPANAVVLPDMLVVYDIANLANPRLIGRFPMPAGQTAARANANFISQVVFGRDRLYVVEGNNGVLALAIPDPTLALTRSGSASMLNWTNADKGFVLEWSDSLTGTWTAVSQPVTVDGNRFSVTETATAERRFYRLRKP